MAKTSSTVERVALPDACSELRMSREQVIRRVNIGELEGGRDPDLGRWFVTRRSIESARAKRESDSARRRAS